MQTVVSRHCVVDKIFNSFDERLHCNHVRKIFIRRVFVPGCEVLAASSDVWRIEELACFLKNNRRTLLFSSNLTKITS